MTAEQQVVSLVEDELHSRRRWYANLHGDGLSGAGRADIVSHDRSGTLCAIECKAKGKTPVYTQIIDAMRVVRSGARSLVAYDDFSLADMDSHAIRTVELPRDLADAADFAFPERRRTYEWVAPKPWPFAG